MEGLDTKLTDRKRTSL